MKFTTSILRARQEILAQGIQQTNHYRMLYPGVFEDYLYPYTIVTPGFGFDLIEHSIWSIIRKIPFRKTFTDLQTTFIVGKNNYKDMIKVWDSLITKPTTGSQRDTNKWSYAQSNGISPNATEETPNFLTNAPTVGQITNGLGGATNYMNKIIGNDLIIELLDEGEKDPYPKINTTFIFREVFVSQVAPVQFTSVDTGYSLFQVNFKFAKAEVG
jgi:hypothetical protein